MGAHRTDGSSNSEFMISDSMKLVLASTSPRRREILSLLGLPFEVVAPDYEEEIVAYRPAEDEVLGFAQGKARSVAGDYPEGLIIGSDTLIQIDGEKIGKPDGIADAKRILRVLSGRTHRILTGVAIIDGTGGPGLETVEEVTVQMQSYSEQQIESYLSCGESLDKAGAYSIQGEGRGLIATIQGDYLAAVGLPLKPIGSYLCRRKIAFSLDMEKLYTDRAYRNWQSFA